MDTIYDATTMHVLLGAALGAGLTLTLVALALLSRAERHHREIVRAHDAGYQSGRARGHDDARRKYAGLAALRRGDRPSRADHSEGVGS